MKSPPLLLTMALLLSSLASAAAPTSYQVTGEVVEVKDDKITVTKGKEKFEIARTAELQATGGELKPGTKVTVEYTLIAKSITVKGGKDTATKDTASKDAATEDAAPAAKPTPKK